MSFHIWFWLLLTISIISLSLNSLISLWVTIELLLAIMLFHLHTNSYTRDLVKIKYFVLQSFTSTLWIRSLLLTMAPVYVTLVALLLKLGLAPVHSWVVQVYSGSDWESIILLSTMMKTPGLVALSHLSQVMFTPLLLARVLVGLLGGWASSTLKTTGMK